MDLQWWIAVIAVPLVGALVGADIMVHKAASRECDDLHKRITMLAAEFAAYRERAAEKFATFETVRHVENTLGRRLDKIDEKIDKLPQRVA